MIYLKNLKLICMVCATCATSSYASTFTWPEPNAPYKETDPFIPSTESDNKVEGIKDVDSDTENNYLNLEDQDLKQMEQPVKELPTEDDPMLRTPLDNRQIEDPILDQDLLDEDQVEAPEDVTPQ